MNSNNLICLLVFIQWFNYNLVLLDHHDKTNYSNTGKCAPTVAGTVAFAVDTTG